MVDYHQIVNHGSLYLEADMPVITRPDTPTHTLPGATFTSLATPSNGSNDTAVWEVRLSAGHPATTHRLTRQEVFVVLDGSGCAQLDGVQHPLAAGSVLVVPPDTDFAIEATGDDPLVALCCLPVGGQAIIGGAEPFTPPWAC
jgi:quercetin dioxygenase-like cupin family protein